MGADSPGAGRRIWKIPIAARGPGCEPQFSRVPGLVLHVRSGGRCLGAPPENREAEKKGLKMQEFDVLGVRVPPAAIQPSVRRPDFAPS